MSNDLLTVEDTLLEEMLSQEAGCEAGHKMPGNTVCSEVVTHRSLTLCAAPDLMVCANAARGIQGAIDAKVWVCGFCYAPAETDWTVTPA